MVKLKLYVWENVLEDYTSGMVVVLAKNEKDAWELLYKEDSTAWWQLQGEPRVEGKGSYSEKAFKKLVEEKKFKSFTAINPQVITEPMAFVVWGGG